MNARLAFASGLIGLLLTILFPVMGLVPIVGPQFAYDFSGATLYQEEISCERGDQGNRTLVMDVESTDEADNSGCYYELQAVEVGWPFVMLSQKLGPDFDAEQLPGLDYPNLESLPKDWIEPDLMPLSVIGNILLLGIASTPLAYFLLQRRGLI